MKNFLSKDNKKTTVILLIFIALSIVVRFFSFFPSVIDHDESTYLEIAREFINGKLLYTDLVDIKPIGIFLITGLIVKIFGNSIFMFRLFAAIIVGFSAHLIYLAKEQIFPDKKTSIASAIIYIIFISTWAYFGGSVNTELFFNFFTILGLYFLLKNNNKILNFVLFGFFIGCGFMIKYFVLFDFVAFSLFYLIITFDKKNIKNNVKSIFNLFIAGLAFTIPFALTHLYFYIKGNYSDFFFITFIATRNYPTIWNYKDILNFIFDFHLRFLPILVIFYFTLFSKLKTTDVLKQIKILSLIWFVFDFIVILLAGNDFGHYMIQLMLPISFLSGAFFLSERKFIKKINRKIKPVILYLLFLTFILALMFSQKQTYIDMYDYPKQVANYLKPKLKETDKIYTSNCEHIIYFLLEKDSPTKYIHRTLLSSKKHLAALEINKKLELNKIIASKPNYIITLDSTYSEIEKLIKTEYVLDTIFNNNVFLYYHK